MSLLIAFFCMNLLDIHNGFAYFGVFLGWLLHLAFHCRQPIYKLWNDAMEEQRSKRDV